MNKRIGVILLDGAEVVAAIFALNRHLRWEKIYSQVKDLTALQSKDTVDYLEIVETLADFLLFGLKLDIKNWKILSRNLPDETLKQISQATRLDIKILDQATEQELICKGALNGV